MEVIRAIPNDIQWGCHLGNDSDMIKAALRAAFVPQAVNPPLTPLVASP
jgi:hypothetical protein